MSIDQPRGHPDNSGGFNTVQPSFPEVALAGRSPRVIAALRAVRNAAPGASMLRMVVVTKDEWTTELNFASLVDEVYGPIDELSSYMRIEPSDYPGIQRVIDAATAALSKVTDRTELGEMDEADEDGNVYLHLS